MISYPQHINDALEQFKKAETFKFQQKLELKVKALAKQLMDEYKENKRIPLKDVKLSSTLRVPLENDQTLVDIQNTFGFQQSSDQTYNIEDITIDLSQDYMQCQLSKIQITEESTTQSVQKESTPSLFFKVKGCKSDIYHFEGCGILKYKQSEKVSDELQKRYKLCGQCQIRKDKGRY